MTSPYQLRILWAMLDHGSIKAAAYALNIKQQTLKNELTAIRRGLDVDTTTQAVWACRDELAAARP